MRNRTKVLLSLAALAGGAAYIYNKRRREWRGFRGRVALVTGGSRGLGLALCRELARRGAKIVLCSIDGAEVEAARVLLQDEGAQVLARVCDVSDINAVAALLRAAEERFGPVELLINNAGTISVGPLETMTAQDFEAAMDVHFRGPLNMCLGVIPGMRERGDGRIVNIASIGGRVAAPHLLPYTASKFALVGFSEGLRAELSRDGVYVTTVCPGLMRTGSAINAWFKGRVSKEYAWFAISDSIPLLSINADRAARRILEACRRGEADLVLTPLAKAVALFHGLFPGATAVLASLVHRALPDSDGQGTVSLQGWQSESPVTRTLVGRDSRRAEIRNNERR